MSDAKIENDKIKQELEELLAGAWKKDTSAGDTSETPKSLIASTPLKTKNPGKFTKWVPKTWQPEYTRILAMHVMGKSNVDIAKALGFTNVHVCNVINTPQGQELKKQFGQKLQEKMMEEVPDRLSRIARKAAHRLEQALDDDALFEKSPFAVIDRALDILKGTKHLSPKVEQPAAGSNGGGGVNIGSAIILSGDQSMNLLEGLEKADSVRRIHKNVQTIDATLLPKVEQPVLPRKASGE